MCVYITVYRPSGESLDSKRGWIIHSRPQALSLVRSAAKIACEASIFFFKHTLPDEFDRGALIGFLVSGWARCARWEIELCCSLVTRRTEALSFRELIRV